MGHYRLLQAAYVQRQPGGVPVWDIGNKIATFRPGVPCEFLEAGETFVAEKYPGPYVEALDEGAKAAEAEWRKKYPNATLDPTRHLPNGQDPLSIETFEGKMLKVLRDMESNAATKSPAQNDVLATIADSQAVMTAAITQLAQTVAALAQPKHRGGAA